MGGFFAGTALGPASLFSHCFGGGGGGDLTSAGEGWNSCWPEAALCACRPLCASICFPPLPLSACFPLVSVRPPVRLSLHFRLPPFAFPPLVLTVLSGLCRHTLPLSARFSFPPLSPAVFYTFCPSIFFSGFFSTYFSLRLCPPVFPLPLSVRFSFPPLSPAVFYVFWQPADRKSVV